MSEGVDGKAGPPAAAGDRKEPGSASAGPSLRDHILGQVAEMGKGGRAGTQTPQLRVVGDDEAVEEPAGTAVVPDRAAE